MRQKARSSPHTPRIQKTREEYESHEILQKLQSHPFICGLLHSPETH